MPSRTVCNLQWIIEINSDLDLETRDGLPVEVVALIKSMTNGIPGTPQCRSPFLYLVPESGGRDAAAAGEGPGEVVAVAEAAIDSDFLYTLPAVVQKLTGVLQTPLPGITGGSESDFLAE